MSKNVYKDLGLPAADELFLKAQLGFRIYKEIKALSLKKASERLGVEEAEITPLKHGEFSGYNVEQLFSFLNRMNYNVDIYLSPSNGTAHQQLHAAD